ncbi:MAG TPA: FAD-dependent monooxygenase [Thermoleophilaceae bacterium]|nr:FAD-dependent monooxygenase [Thermoleophilaceae bacterium]
MTRALVIGGGIGGLTTARALAQQGIEAHVFERAPALEKIQVGGAIHVWHNGMRGLQRLGLAADVQRLGGRAAAVETAEMRNWKGRVIARWSALETEQEVGAPTVGVKRPELHEVLARGLAEGVLRLGRECTGFEQGAEGVKACFSDGSEESGDVLIGADGLLSVVRRGVLGEEKLRFARYASWQSVAEHRNELTPEGLFCVIWGPGARFLFYRLDSERLYWEGIFATEPGGRDPEGGRKRAVLGRFGSWAAPVPSIIEATRQEDIGRSDVYDRPPTKKWGEGRVTLLGDAAHPMTNAAGQGANQAIEDAVVLGDRLGRATDLESGLREYERERIARSGKIVALASGLTALSRWGNPVAVRLRDPLIALMMATIAKRKRRQDMAYKF